MGIGFFAAGQKVQIDGTQYKISDISHDEQVNLVNVNTRKNSFVELVELKKKYVSGQVVFISRARATVKNDGSQFDENILLCQISEKEQRFAKQRYAYVSAVLNEKLTFLTKESIEPVVDVVWEKLNREGKKPHWSTVWRWVKKYNDGANSISALFTRNDKKGNRTRRYQDNLLEIVDDASQLYLTGERLTVKDVLDQAIAMVARENKKLPESMHLPLPTRSLVKKAIDDMPAYDKKAARYGLQAAKRDFRHVMSNMSAERILERVEIDHTILDLIVLDSKTYMPLGRPTLTICVDVKSRCILGIYVGFEPPSFSTVVHCLHHAFMPKLDIKEKYPSVVGEWPCYGVMENLVVDNGLEFHSKGLESMCYEFNIKERYMPRKTPWYKGIVERLIRTLNDGLSHKLPGTTFSNIFEKGDYDASQKAVVVLSELEEMLHKWVIDIYHNDIHRTIGKPPIVEWRDGVTSIDIPLPDNIQDLEFMSAIPVKRVLDHKGIQINNLFYNSDDLAQLRMRLGEKIDVEVRYTPTNLGSIFVVEPKTMRRIKVSAINSNYAEGLTLWAHKVCERHAKYHMNRSDIEALAESKEYIRNMCLNSLSNKKMKTRKAAKRFADATECRELEGSVIDDGNYSTLQPQNAPGVSADIALNPKALSTKRISLGDING